MTEKENTNQTPKVESVSINDIKEAEANELVDSIMAEILKIK